MMRILRVTMVAALSAALLVLVVPAAADGCPPPGAASGGSVDPNCRLSPLQSRQVNPYPGTSQASLGELTGGSSGSSINFRAPLSLGDGSASHISPSFVPLAPLGPSSQAPPIETLDIRMRYQRAGDSSTDAVQPSNTCGVEALGMALDGLGASGPNSSALLGYLNDHGMMYDFGTGVEELAFAAQSFGYADSRPFYNGSLALLQAELAVGHPVVADLGANGDGKPGHFVTVTGVSSDGNWIAVNDPTLGRRVLPAAEFLRQWALQGSSGVTVGPSAALGADSDAATLAAATGATPDPSNASPLLLLVAALMALVSNAGLGRWRLGIGGSLTKDKSGGGGSGDPPYPAPDGKQWVLKSVPVFTTRHVQDGWDQVPRAVPVKEKKWVQVGTTTVTDMIPKFKTVEVQDGWDIVPRRAPKMVTKRVQVGTTTVTDKIPRYKTVQVQQGWDHETVREAHYKNEKYVKYYRTVYKNETYWSKSGGEWVKRTRTVSDRVPVYGTRRVFTGYTYHTKRTPHMVTKRVLDGYNIVTTRVPKYEERQVQQGWTYVNERVPHMVTKKVQDGWTPQTTEVPKFGWDVVQTGWTTSNERVPHIVTKQEQVGTSWEWVLEDVTNTSHAQRAEPQGAEDFSGPQIGSPQTFIESPFFDPKADFNGTAYGWLMVNRPPFDVTNPSNLGLSPKSGGMGVLIQALNLARSWLSYLAAADHLGTQPPDVDARLHYTIDWSDGARIPGVEIINKSRTLVSVSDVLVTGTQIHQSLAPLESATNAGLIALPVNVPPGETRSIGLEQPKEAFNDPLLNIQVTLRLIVRDNVVPISWDISLATGAAVADK